MGGLDFWGGESERGGGGGGRGREKVAWVEALPGGGGDREGRGGALSFPILGGGRRGLGGGGGDRHWCLKGRGVWVVGLSFPRPFFGFLFCFLGFGVVESAMKLGMEVWVRWE